MKSFGRVGGAVTSSGWMDGMISRKRGGGNLRGHTHTHPHPQTEKERERERESYEKGQIYWRFLLSLTKSLLEFFWVNISFRVLDLLPASFASGIQRRSFTVLYSTHNHIFGRNKFFS